MAVEFPRASLVPQPAASHSPEGLHAREWSLPSPLQLTDMDGMLGSGSRESPPPGSSTRVILIVESQLPAVRSLAVLLLPGEAAEGVSIGARSGPIAALPSQ